MAKLGFGYDNCVICGTNGTAPRTRAVSLPFNTGDTFLSNVGNQANTVALTVNNLAPFQVQTPINQDRYTTASGSLHPWGPHTPGPGTDILTSQTLGLGTPASIQNYGIIDLWFKAVS